VAAGPSSETLFLQNPAVSEDAIVFVHAAISGRRITPAIFHGS